MNHAITLLLIDLYLQVFIVKNRLSGMRFGFCYTTDVGPSLKLLCVILLLPMLWKFYNFGSAEPVHSCAPVGSTDGMHVGIGHHITLILFLGS